MNRGHRDMLWLLLVVRAMIAAIPTVGWIVIQALSSLSLLLGNLPRHSLGLAHPLLANPDLFVVDLPTHLFLLACRTFHQIILADAGPSSTSSRVGRRHR